MRLAKFLNKLTVACFLLMWIPFCGVKGARASG
jgi:hypothetical protein